MLVFLQQKKLFLTDVISVIEDTGARCGLFSSKIPRSFNDLFGPKIFDSDRSHIMVIYRNAQG